MLLPQEKTVKKLIRFRDVQEKLPKLPKVTPVDGTNCESYGVEGKEVGEKEYLSKLNNVYPLIYLILVYMPQETRM